MSFFSRDHRELAAYFVLKVEELGYLVTNLVMACRDTLDLIIQRTVLRRAEEDNKKVGAKVHQVFSFFF